MTVSRNADRRSRPHRTPATRATGRKAKSRRNSVELINAVQALLLAIATLLGAATTFIVEVFGR